MYANTEKYANTDSPKIDPCEYVSPCALLYHPIPCRTALDLADLGLYGTVIQINLGSMRHARTTKRRGSSKKLPQRHTVHHSVFPRFLDLEDFDSNCHRHACDLREG
jgi:hypothetical protein